MYKMNLSMTKNGFSVTVTVASVMKGFEGYQRLCELAKNEPGVIVDLIDHYTGEVIMSTYND